MIHCHLKKMSQRLIRMETKEVNVLSLISYLCDGFSDDIATKLIMMA